MLASTLKFLAIAWVGLVMLVGLYTNGERLYSWIGGKARQERDQMAKVLDLMFFDISPARLFNFYSAYLVLLFSLGTFLLWPSIGGGLFFGALFTVIGWRLPALVITVLHRRRIKKFVNQMVDGLSLMSNAMRSGLNVPQAMSIVTDELPNPISQEFALVLSQNNLGVTLEEAMSNLSVRMPN